jgi:hypothetical protein
MSVARSLCLTLLACALIWPATDTAGQTPETIPGRLTKAGPSSEKASREHAFEVLAGQRIDVRLRSDEFDAFLQLVPPATESFYREPLTNDDDGGGTDSRVAAIAGVAGTWRAIVTAFDENEGDYELDIELGSAGTVQNVERRTLGSADSVSMKGRRYAVYPLTLPGQSELLVELVSDEFEPYVIAVSPSGERFTSEATSEGGIARVEVPGAEAGRWRVLATQDATSEETTGSFAMRMIHSPSAATEATTGALEESDPQDIDGELYDVYRIAGTPSRPLVIQLASTDFDAYLSARSPTGQWFRDDDGGGETNARLELPALEGTWFVVVTSFSGGGRGRYRLTVGR